MTTHPNIPAAIEVLKALGLPRAQQNERSALCLLAILNLTPEKEWADAENPLIGITPIMDWARDHYGTEYKPNTRETFRRQTMHQFVDAGLALYNPDRPDRPVNSPKAVYQIAPEALELLRGWGQQPWEQSLGEYLSQRVTLAAQYAKARDQVMVPVNLTDGQTMQISPGVHSELIKAIIEDFAPRFAPGSQLVYAGDTGEKLGYFDQPYLAKLGVGVDTHGKMPDVVLHYTERGWLLLVEAVTSHGPVDGKAPCGTDRAFQRLNCGAGLRDGLSQSSAHGPLPIPNYS